MAIRARHAEEEGAEGYFASVSDLMVGILFIFLLMLTVFALNFHDAADQQVVEKSKLEEALRAAEVAQQAAALAAEEARMAKEAAERERHAAVLAAELAKSAEASAERQRRAAESATANALLAEAKAREQSLLNQKLRRLLDQAVAQLEHELKDRELARNRLLSSIEQAMRDRNIRVTLDSRSGILRLSGDLLFETGQSELKPAARQTVSVLADVLARVLGCYAEGGKRDGCDANARSILESVLVEGHTDRQPYSKLSAGQSLERNDQLLTERALTVFKELRQLQPSLDLLMNTDQQPLMAFSGYGQRRPLAEAQGSSETDHQRNRRIDLRFVLSARTSDQFNQLREQIREVLEHP